MLNLVVKIERKHLPEDPDWVDSDEEADPDDSIFENELKGLEEGSEEYEEKKEELMDNWRDGEHAAPPCSPQQSHPSARSGL